MTNLTLSREMQNMAERLAENAHDIWAKRKVEELEACGEWRTSRGVAVLDAESCPHLFTFMSNLYWILSGCFFKLANRKSVLVLSKLNRQIRHPSSFLILDDFDLDDFDCFR